MKKIKSDGINWEQVSFSIIASAGTAKSIALEGLTFAKKGKFTEAKKELDKANKEITKASGMHFDVIQEEAKGTQLDFKVLFLHAEDQLLTIQTLILVIEELIEVYKRFKK